MTVGFLVRTSIVSAIFRKALRLSGKSRQHHSTGQITTMISADCTRLDIASGFFHLGWSAPIQIAIGMGLLCVAGVLVSAQTCSQLAQHQESGRLGTRWTRRPIIVVPHGTHTNCELLQT